MSVSNMYDVSDLYHCMNYRVLLLIKNKEECLSL